MKRLPTRFISIIILAAISTFTRGDDIQTDPPGYFFIHQGHPAAADDNAGTEDKPFKTIKGGFTALAKRVKPGDTIYIKEGVYRDDRVRLDATDKNGSLAFPSGESYGRMISIRAYPGHKPVLNGGMVLTGWQPYQDNIWSIPFEKDTTTMFPVTFADGKPLQQIGGTVERAPEYWKGKKGETLADLEAGSYYFDPDQHTLYVWLADGGDPNQHLMETYGSGGLGTGSGLSYILISGLTYTYCGVGVQGSHCILENIDQSYASKGGCGIYGEYHTIVNSRFNHNGNTGISGNGRGHRILDCETSYNNWRRWSAGWSAGGVKMIPNVHDTVIKGHVAIGNIASAGIWFDAGMANVTIEGCTAYKNDGIGIFYEIGTHGIIKNNLCYENGSRGIYISNSSYTTIAHNICYRNGMSGIVVIGVNRVGGTLGRGPGNYHPGGHNVVWGNILVDNCWDASRDLEKFPTWGDRPELIMPSDREGNEGCSSDYNLFWRSGERGGEALNRLSFGKDWNTGFAKGLEDWQKKTGWDTHSIIAKPLFVDEAAHNFRPAPGSPALWAMTKLDASIAYDFDNVKRSKKIHSIGAFEGDIKELEKIQQDPPAGPHRLFPLKFKGSQPMGESINFARYARGILFKDHAVDLGFGLVGVRLQNIPFVRDSSEYVVLDRECQVVNMPLGGEVKRLHLLLAVDHGQPGKPLAQALISRGDGMTITLEWSLDSDGKLVAGPAGSTTTIVGETGSYSKIGNAASTEDVTVYITSWDNDNEWYPVDTIEFKLLDPAAYVTFLGVTGDRLQEGASTTRPAKTATPKPAAVEAAPAE